MTRLADRSMEIVAPQPGPVRGRRPRAAPGGGRGRRRRARVRRHGPGRAWLRRDRPGAGRPGRGRRGGVRLRRRRAEPRRLDGRARRRGARARSGWAARSSSRSVAARRWTPPRLSTCARPTTSPVWDLEYDGPDLEPGPPGRRGADDRRDRRRDQLLRGHHRRGGRAQGLHRPSVPAAGDDDPRPGTDPRAAAGGDGRDRHRRDDPFARIAALGQPQPVRRGDGARRHPDHRHVAAARGRRRHGPRGAIARC